MRVSGDVIWMVEEGHEVIIFCHGGRRSGMGQTSLWQSRPTVPGKKSGTILERKPHTACEHERERAREEEATGRASRAAVAADAEEAMVSRNLGCIIGQFQFLACYLIQPCSAESALPRPLTWLDPDR